MFPIKNTHKENSSYKNNSSNKNLGTCFNQLKIRDFVTDK